jgi:hypothetical protein
MMVILFKSFTLESLGHGAIEEKAFKVAKH